MPVSKGDLAQKIWDVITSAYGQGATTKVEVPIEDVVHILQSVTANLLAQTDVGTRDRVMREMMPKLENLISTVRARSSLVIHARPADGVLLPH